MSGCCALGTCTDPKCRLCTVTAKLPQPVWGQKEHAKFAEPVPRERPSRDPVFTPRKRKAL